MASTAPTWSGWPGEGAPLRGSGINNKWSISGRFVDTEMERPRWRFTLNYHLVPNATFVCGDNVQTGIRQREVWGNSKLLRNHSCTRERTTRTSVQNMAVAQTWRLLSVFSRGHQMDRQRGKLAWSWRRDMYWSHTDKETYLHWLKMSGFDVIWDRFIPDGLGGHVLFFAKKNENR